VEKALYRLVNENDSRVAALSQAAMFAPRVARQQPTQVHKDAQESVYDEMEALAKRQRLPGETVAKAFVRLQRERDPEMVALEAKHYAGRQ
jgi:hypothetical protein